MTHGCPGFASGSGLGFQDRTGAAPGKRPLRDRTTSFQQRTPAMVLSAFVRRWMNCKGFAPPRGRQPATRPSRRRPRLRLEALEDRCVPSTVMNLFDSGLGSLRQALLDTPAGGTVDFQSGLTGTIPLTSGELAISKNLTITGPGASALTVSGNHASRVFDIAAGFTVAISGLTIADGSVTNANGGGILNAGTLTLTDCLLSGNSTSGMFTTGNGGGIYNSGGTLTITASTLMNNSASGAVGGGGISNQSGTLTITESTFSHNSAADGGGIDNENGGILTVSGSTF